MADEHLRWHGERARLNDPILLAAFVRRTGHGTTAVASLAHLASAHDGQLIADIDPEHFFDFTVTSPVLQRSNDQRVLAWPRNEIYRLRQNETSRDVVVLLGTEPHLRWGGFAGALREFIAEAGVREVVIVYSWPASVPHTRPVMLRLTTEDTDLAQRLGLPPAALDYLGPVDFGTMLTSSLDPAVRSAGLSGIVPNYLGVVPNPFAMVALVEAYDRLCGTQTDLAAMRELAEQVRTQADDNVAGSPELADAIRQMEEQYEAQPRRGWRRGLAVRARRPAPRHRGVPQGSRGHTTVGCGIARRFVQRTLAPDQPAPCERTVAPQVNALQSLTGRATRHS
jgi:predicted ATP-grasp superfamily ATP-dependent carboligase